jgi:hypothetical protein
MGIWLDWEEETKPMGSCLQALADKLDSQQLGSEGFLLAIDYIFKITTLIVVINTRLK